MDGWREGRAQLLQKLRRLPRMKARGIVALIERNGHLGVQSFLRVGQIRREREFRDMLRDNGAVLCGYRSRHAARSNDLRNHVRHRFADVTDFEMTPA